jgi:hypothetical protein
MYTQVGMATMDAPYFYVKAEAVQRKITKGNRHAR